MLLRNRNAVRSLIACLWPLVAFLTAISYSGHTQAESSSPFSAVVRVNLETGGHCTGFAIDREHVLTAAHCLWLQRPRNWIRPTSLHILAGYDRGNYRQHLRVRSYAVAARYAPGAGNSAQPHDWALLTLEGAFSGATLPLANRPPRRQGTYAMAGYASTRRHRLTRRVACMIREMGAGVFLHGCPSAKGESGAPMIGFEDGRRVAFGLHVASSRSAGLAVMAHTIRQGLNGARRPY